MNRESQTAVEPKSNSGTPKEGKFVPKTPAPVHATRRWRLRAVAVLLGALALLMVLRLFTMQVSAWQDFSPRTQTFEARYTVDDNTPWGVIVDRDGVLLAADRYTYRITATPNQIKPEAWPKIAQILWEKAGIPPDQTRERLAQNSESAYLVLGTEVSFAAGRAVLEEQERLAAQDDELLLHVLVSARPRRFYPQGQLASQVLGFVNAERKPVLGVERYYDSFLPSTGVGLPRGGRQSRDVIPLGTQRFLAQGSEKGLVLTIDRTIQWIIEEELKEAIGFYKAEAGSIIVMEPNTGAILGMANWPTFDANTYERENAATFTNSSVSAQYEPGSIFKLVTVAGAVDAGAVEPLTVFTDTGTIVVGQRTIQNSTRTAVGQLTVADALAQSNNVVTVQIAQALGQEGFYDYVSLFGFGADTNIDLSGEIPGLVKRPGDPAWSLSDLGTNSFGQGIAVTPIQMLSAVAAMVNGGKLMRPYIVQARVHGQEVLMTQPTTAHQVLDPETSAMMREMMVHVVDTGNLQAKVPEYSVGGKSGTAEIATAEGYSEETIASFIGFAPADDPQFVVLVKLDRPDTTIARWASQSAAPVFKRVTFRLLDHLNIPPDAERVRE
ncbi:MAG: penicillin-binding protein 2 [Caldilineaceae bacterium]|nr:penicillin-binding protein 2 [Caldilineaceae bacterium]